MASGLAGACVLTLLNEVIRKLDDNAPRLDLLGIRAISDTIDGGDLRNKALAADLVANSLLFSIVGTLNPEDSAVCGTALGITAGVGAIILPERLGLGRDTTNGTRKSRILSVAYYGVAGLVAGLVYRRIS